MYILIASGLLLFITGGFGVIAAIRENRYMLYLVCFILHVGCPFLFRHFFVYHFFEKLQIELFINYNDSIKLVGLWKENSMLELKKLINSYAKLCWNQFLIVIYG